MPTEVLNWSITPVRIDGAHRSGGGVERAHMTYVVNENDDSPEPGNLKKASTPDLQAAAKADGYNSIETWKQQELQLNSKSEIMKDANGELYSVPRLGGGPPQRLGVTVPK